MLALESNLEHWPREVDAHSTRPCTAAARLITEALHLRFAGCARALRAASPIAAEVGTVRGASSLFLAHSHLGLLLVSFICLHFACLQSHRHAVQPQHWLFHDSSEGDDYLLWLRPVPLQAISTRDTRTMFQQQSLEINRQNSFHLHRGPMPVCLNFSLSLSDPDND